MADKKKTDPTKVQDILGIGKDLEYLTKNSVNIIDLKVSPRGVIIILQLDKESIPGVFAVIFHHPSALFISGDMAVLTLYLQRYQPLTFV